MTKTNFRKTFDYLTDKAPSICDGICMKVVASRAGRKDEKLG